MISNAFKGAYTNQVAQQNQGISTISAGVKSAAVLVAGIAGFAGALGSGAMAQGAQHALANRIGGIGGNIMLSTMNQKVYTARQNRNANAIAEGKEPTFTASQIGQTIQSQLGDNPINRSAVKQLSTVFETLASATEEGTINKKGNIESSIGDIDPNSELGKKVLKELEKGEDKK